MNKKRILYIDYLRALAIILVLFAHISSHSYSKFLGIYLNTSVKWSICASFVDIGVIGVPLFLMITGALLLNRDMGNLKDFVKRRYLRILPPFIFWALIVFNIFTFWYVWLMMGIYLILPVINSFIKEYELNGVEYFLIIWIISIILNTFGHYPFYKLELSYFYGYIGYVVLGYYLANKKFNVSNKTMIILNLIIFCVFTLINVSYTLKYNQASKHAWLTYLTIVVVFQSTSVFLIFKNLEEYFNNIKFKIPNKIYKVTNSISRCSYGMYLDHCLILDYLLSLNIIEKLFVMNPLYWLIIAIILIPFSSWLIIYVLSKIPYIKYISGAH